MKQKEGLRLLNTDQIKDSLNSSQGAAILLQVYTQTVLRTPDIILPERINELSGSSVVEDLPMDQKEARENAEFYLTDVNPTLVSQCADIIGFANLWNAEYKHLMRLAEDIEFEGNKEEFKQGIENLINQAKVKKEDAAVALEALKTFLPKIEMDERNFTRDASNVQIALGGAEGEISILEKEIVAYNDAISTDLMIIGLGSGGIVIGGLMVAVGILGEFASAGTSTALVVGGLVVAGGSGTAVGFAADNLSKTKKKLSEATRELAIDKQIYACTKQASINIEALKASVGMGIDAVNSLMNGWESLEGDFQQVIDQLSMSTPELGAWLVDSLEAANQDWQDTLALAKELQKFGTLPTTVENYEAA